MAPNPKVVKACKAMKAYGITEGTVLAVLKKLLDVYDKNWAYIEDENYRVLVDAVFDTENIQPNVNDETPVRHQGKRKLELPNQEEGYSVKLKSVASPLDHNGGHGEGEAICCEMPLNDAPHTIINSAGPSHLDDSCMESGDPKHLESEERDTSAPSHIELASSSNGEVKISLICNSPDVHVQSLDAVYKAMEEKCRTSYNITYPAFPLKVMKDICEYFLSMGTVSKSSDPVNPENGPTVDEPELSNQLVVADQRLHKKPKFDIAIDLSDGSTKIQNLFRIQSCIPRFQVSNDMVGLDSNGGGYGGNINKNITIERPKLLELCDVEVVQKESASHVILKASCFVDDITKGEESRTISLINEINKECQPAFHYIPKNIIYRSAYVKFLLARISDDNCCSNCVGDCMSQEIPCACTGETGGEFAYLPGGLLREDFLEKCKLLNEDVSTNLFYCKDCPLQRSEGSKVSGKCNGHVIRKFIKECWFKCGCSRRCGNRVVQRGITANLQVFMTPGGKGWGLRTLETLPKGAFVCEYVGEIVTNTELFDRNKRSAGERHTYPVLLDADWGSEGVLKDEEALCLDATSYGNIARFINHRCCDANMIEIPVEIETPDHHYYHLAFFTSREVSAYEELTWDYGIDFNDTSHPIKAFKCCCGSKLCRQTKHRKRTRTSS